MEAVPPTDANTTAAPDEPVTLVVRHTVRPGLEREFEAWAKGMSEAALKFRGHLGVNIIRPPAGSSGEYVVIYRFDTYEHLRGWMSSGIRESFAKDLDEFVTKAPRFEEVCGLEFWFESPAPGRKAPPKAKMVLVTWLVLTPLVLFVPPHLVPLIQRLGLPQMAASAIVVGLLVLIMTYAAMPVAVRMFRRWLDR